MILSIFQILKQNVHSFGYQNPDASKIEIIKPTSVDGFDDVFRICDQLGVELTDDHVVELHIDGRLEYEDFEVTGRLFKLELMLETKEEFRQRLEDELKLKYLQATGESYE
nr:MAG TPA: hypothetical protein [Caudoviricetes sp.]